MKKSNDDNRSAVPMQPDIYERAKLDNASLNYDPDELLTPEQFGRIVGASQSALRNEHVRGHFRAAIYDPSGGRGRKRMYTVTQVRLYRARKSTYDFTDEYSGEQAQRCFQIFDDGGGVRRCVREVGLHPILARKVHDEWASLDGELVLQGDELRAIEAVPYDGPAKLKTGADVVEAIKAISEAAKCPDCEKRVKQICKACAARRGSRRSAA